MESNRRSGRKRAIKEDEEEVEVEKVETETPRKLKRGVTVKEEPETEILSPRSRSKAEPAKNGAKPAQKSSKKGLKFDQEELSEDPYAFKEPEPFESQPAAKSPNPPPAKAKREASPERPKKGAVSRLKKESQSSSTDSDDSVKKSTRKSVKKEEPKEEVKVEEEEASESDAEEKPIKKSAKNTRQKKEEDESKPVLQLTKKQQELFPHLAAIRATAVPGCSSTTPTSAPPKTAAEPEPTETKEPSTKPETTTPSKHLSAAAAKPKRKTPNKPISSELVIESETSDDDSDEFGKNSQSKNSTKPLPPPPTASSTDNYSSDESVARRRSKFGSSEESEDGKKKAKKEPKEETDTETLDLACVETIPGSPVLPGSSEDTREASDHEAEDRKPKSVPKPAQTSPNSGKTKRSEMPFASVPESVQETKGEPAEKVMETEDNAVTPDDYLSSRSNSQSPTTVTRQTASAGGASANEADSKLGDSTSEVDMEDSLSGDHRSSSKNDIDIETDQGKRSTKSAVKRRFPGSTGKKQLISF